MSRRLLFLLITFLYGLSFCDTDSLNNTNSIARNKEQADLTLDVASENAANASEQTIPNAKMSTEIDPEIDPFQQSKRFENAIKNTMKRIVKEILPQLMKFNADPSNTKISPKCMKSLIKYIGALTSAKVWAIRMLDSTSKPPAGIFEGTFADFGAFDECLEISLPTRKGGEEFRGSYCAIEARPFMMPRRKNFSLAHRYYAQPLDSIGKEAQLAGSTFWYSQFRFGVCVPSTCSTDDVQNMATNVGKLIQMNVKIPKCYVKEDVKLEGIHIGMIFVLILLTLLAAAGTMLEIMQQKKEATQQQTNLQQVLLAFSLIQNYKRLMAPSKGPGDLKVLHGIRALSTAWVILGHVYVWTNFQLVRRPVNLQNYFNELSFEAILNAWLSVESFIFLSGLLTCYGCIQMMEKTKGRIHVPFFILRRYIRLTPAFLVVMGLIFFLPLISSGPFWYEKIDHEIQSCRTNWWTNVLYINNWFSMKEICVHPTWYLSADFQLHIMSLLILYPLYRSRLLGYISIGVTILTGFLIVAFVTYWFDLPPIILISSGNEQLIADTVDNIHMRTFTHTGPYCVGMLTGYIILKHKDVKLNRLTCCLLWCLSFIVSVSSLYGSHRWSSGNPHGLFLTCLYGAAHRTTFIAGVAWLVFACVTGRAGPINAFLSSHLFILLSRLTYTTYLIQSLVIWTRRGSERDRFYYSHYNLFYEWIANWVVSVLLAIPLNLLVEAPVANLDRLMFSRAPKKENETENTENADKENRSPFPEQTVSQDMSDKFVQLKSVTTIQPDILNMKSMCDQRSNGSIKE